MKVGMAITTQGNHSGIAILHHWPIVSQVGQNVHELLEENQNHPCGEGCKGPPAQTVKAPLLIPIDQVLPM